jgi:hypothetical protein
MARKKWVTLVGEHAPVTSPAEEAALKPYWLEQTSTALLSGIDQARRLEAAERDRLLYERGGGAAKPGRRDGLPEPEGPKRSGQKPRRLKRKPTDGAEV